MPACAKPQKCPLHTGLLFPKLARFETAFTILCAVNVTSMRINIGNSRILSIYRQSINVDLQKHADGHWALSRTKWHIYNNLFK
jgi:hypothetical protein